MVDEKNTSVECSCCSDCADASQDTQENNAGGCSCGSGCCDDTNDNKVTKRQIDIDFLYLDLSVCTRCQGTDTSLDDALADVSKVLKATGVEVLVNKVNILSEEQAIEYRFVSSPTIRVNGRDIQMDVKENLCESCGDLCGDTVDCRLWIYNGEEYTVPPKAMIVEAILKEVYGNTNHAVNQDIGIFDLPDNLKNFFKALSAKQAFQGGMNMKTLKIEWRHLDVEGETCDRCYDTGENLANEIKRLKRALQPQGIEVEYSEIKLDDTKIPQSNTILFNGTPIEDILDIKVSENYCDSCTTLLGKETHCRTVVFEGNEYEDIPAKAIRQAAYKALGLNEANNDSTGKSGCCGNGGCSCC